MSLCHNRLEGLGPHSSSHPSAPTTCFNDVILLPLATWIYIFLLLPAALIYIHAHRRKLRTHQNPTNASDMRRTTKPKMTKLGRALSILYYVLVVIMVIMTSLIIARLFAAKLGIGLLPFLHVALILVGWVHWLVVTRKHGHSKTEVLVFVLANSAWWVLLAVMLGVSVASVTMEGASSRTTAEAERMYPWRDEITDKGAMMGVAVVLAGLEVWNGVGGSGK